MLGRCSQMVKSLITWQYLPAGDNISHETKLSCSWNMRLSLCNPHFIFDSLLLSQLYCWNLNHLLPHPKKHSLNPNRNSLLIFELFYLLLAWPFKNKINWKEIAYFRFEFNECFLEVDWGWDNRSWRIQ